MPDVDNALLDVKIARRAHRALDAAGGLVGRGGIARGCQPPVSMPRAHELTELAGFPAPYARVGNTPVWIVADVALWFHERGRQWAAPPLADAGAAAPTDDS